MGGTAQVGAAITKGLSEQIAGNILRVISRLVPGAAEKLGITPESFDQMSKDLGADPTLLEEALVSAFKVFDPVAIFSAVRVAPGRVPSVEKLVNALRPLLGEDLIRRAAKTAAGINEAAATTKAVAQYVATREIARQAAEYAEKGTAPSVGTLARRVAQGRGRAIEHQRRKRRASADWSSVE
jgi:hypothetical protein